MKHGGNKAKEIIIQIVINYNICVTEIVMQNALTVKKRASRVKTWQGSLLPSFFTPCEVSMIRRTFLKGAAAVSFSLMVSPALTAFAKDSVRVYVGGPIFTMNKNNDIAEAIAVKGETILAVGKKAEVMAAAGSGATVVDLKGKALIPGMIDGHSHFVSAGLMAATQLDLSSPPVGGVKNIAEIKGLIRAKAAETPKGEWILGFGYDDTGLEDKRHPLASDIDEVAPEHPVLLRHVSGHLSACNGLALAKANYTKDTPDPVGGVIRRDEHGNPNGVLEEPPAREPVFRHIPAPTEADWMEGIKAACAAYTAKGVTTAQDGFTATGDWGALKRAHELGLLRNRVQILPGVSRMDINTFNTHVSGTQLTADGKISLGAAKLLADGSLQCYTGYLSNPYHKVIYDLPDGPMWRGYPMEPEQQFIEKVVGLHRQGWQLAIHGNGDDAIQMILNAYEEAQKRYPPRRRPAHRHPLPDRARGSARPHQAAWRGALVLCGPHLFLGRPPL